MKTKIAVYFCLFAIGTALGGGMLYGTLLALGFWALPFVK